jgi:glucuronokinase
VYPSEGPLRIVEEAAFDNLLHLHRHSCLLGYTSGLRLVQATCKVFCQLAVIGGVSDTTLRSRGGILKFHTTIPRMVGLSGSSAIITATFRALMKLYELSLDDLHIAREEFPAVLLSIEQEELGIKAGLQDRVIQAYGGLVHMDFTRSKADHNIYTPLPPSLLPPLYLLYNTDAGGDSGSVHSTVRQRYDAGDDTVVAGMQQISTLADMAVTCLRERHYSQLADCMEANFANRRQLYGDEVVGAKNIAAAQLAQSLGFAVKFTGSGGSFICLHRPSVQIGKDGAESVEWLSAAAEEEYRRRFAQLQFALERVELPDEPLYHLSI